MQFTRRLSHFGFRRQPIGTMCSNIWVHDYNVYVCLAIFLLFFSASVVFFFPSCQPCLLSIVRNGDNKVISSAVPISAVPLSMSSLCMLYTVDTPHVFEKRRIHFSYRPYVFLPVEDMGCFLFREYSGSKPGLVRRGHATSTPQRKLTRRRSCGRFLSRSLS